MDNESRRFREVEQSQKALKETIEENVRLIEESKTLIERHKREIEKG